jgi:hypothetical protein
MLERTLDGIVIVVVGCLFVVFELIGIVQR